MLQGDRPARQQTRVTSAALLFDAVETAREAVLFVALVGCGTSFLWRSWAGLEAANARTDRMRRADGIRPSVRQTRMPSARAGPLGRSQQRVRQRPRRHGPARAIAERDIPLKRLGDGYPVEDRDGHPMAQGKHAL